MEEPKLRILVVDDIADNRVILNRRLTRRGFFVTEAAGGQEALALLAEQQFDLVLLDVMMPDLDGISVLHHIRERHSPSAVPVIMVTAIDQSHSVVEALEAGANDYVTKPVDFPVVLARVQTQLARKQAEDQLQRINAELEQRVAERTALLTDTNRQLELEIVEREKTEQDLRAAKAVAEAASRAKTAFLASISHELRTPLNAIIGFSELLRARPTGSLVTAEDKDYAVFVEGSGRALLELIENILLFANTESGATPLCEKVCDITDLVLRTAAKLECTARSRSIAVEVAIPADFALVRLDGALFATALIHVLSNALKFSHDGGKVELSARLEADGAIVILCRDAGIGIAADHIEAVLQPFTQLDMSLARRYEGLGMGLPLARSLLELHQGRLTIDSEPGRGTCVALTLPAERVMPVVELRKAS